MVRSVLCHEISEDSRSLLPDCYHYTARRLRDPPSLARRPRDATARSAMESAKTSERAIFFALLVLVLVVVGVSRRIVLLPMLETKLQMFWEMRWII
jgi:hypothetical protein